MLRPGGVACPAPARTFTTELSWAGSPQRPKSVITGWFIVIYHRRTFTGWTGSLMGCELIFANESEFSFSDSCIAAGCGQHRFVPARHYHPTVLADQLKAFWASHNNS